MTEERNLAYGMVDAALDSLDPGVEHSETDREQLAVLMEAFIIFRERNAKRADLWREFGWEDSVLHIRSKALRLALLLKDNLDIDPPEVLDDSLDLINYAVFFVRNVRNPK